jgi:hypothetical protein
MSLTALGVPGSLGALVFTGLVLAGAPTGAAVAAGVAIGLVAFAVQVNAWGIQDDLRRTAGIPPAPGEAQPRLVISLAELPVRDKMHLRTVNEPVVSVTNNGPVPATGCRLSVTVKCDEFKRTGAPVTVEPDDPETGRYSRTYSSNAIKLCGRSMQLSGSEASLLHCSATCCTYTRGWTARQSQAGIGSRRRCCTRRSASRSVSQAGLSTPSVSASPRTTAPSCRMPGERSAETVAWIAAARVR